MGDLSKSQVVTTISKGGSPLGSVEEWKLGKDRARLIKSIQEEKERIEPNKDVIAGLRAELGKINAEYKRRGQSSAPSATDDALPARRPGSGPDLQPGPTRTGSQKATITDEQRDACVAKLRQLKKAL